MNRLVIPSILAATVLVAGMFVFMPVDKASTVHTVIQANTIRMVSVDSAQSTAADQNMRITCPATALSGCRILEVYVDETTNNQVQLDQIDGIINGDAIANLIDINPDQNIQNARALVAPIGGVAIGPSDTLTIVTDDANTVDAARYNFRVIAQVQGAETVTLSFV